MATSPRKQDKGPLFLVRPLVEFSIVAGACLYFIFYLIPAQTSDGANFGLSPRMVPIVCCALIGILATVSLLASLFGKPTTEAAPVNDGLGTVGLLIGASLLGVTVVHWFGLIAGGIVLVALASWVIGERRWLQIAMLSAAAGLLMFAVKWLGL